MLYDIEGNVIQSTSSTSIPVPFMSINHQGYRADGASDNSLNAFKASYAHGFRAVETDIRYSSDNVPVLAHNETYGNYTIAETTYAVLAESGITSLEELIAYCKVTGLIPYLELKIDDNTLTDYAIAVVSKYGMMRNVVWISAYYDAVKYVTTVCEYASVRKQNASLSACQALNTGKNVVGGYFNTGASGTGVDAETVSALAQAGFAVGGYTYSSQTANFAIDNARGVTEFTTDRYRAEDYILVT